MKKLALIFVLLCTSPAFATTWYVRSDGGTRYSADVTTGQCNGQADQPYPGSGVNQNCAFNDIRFLWAEGIYTTGNAPGWGWVIAGGDTVMVRDCIQYSAPHTPIPGSSGGCRIGYSGPNSTDYYLAIAGGPAQSGMPPPPNGTAGAHTRILGVNYANCTSPSAKAQVYGGYDTGAVFGLSGISYVDIACFDVTDHSNCGRSSQANACNTSYPLTDFASNGFTMSNTTTNTTLTDISIHGMAASGGLGPTGDGVSLLRVSMKGNASAGWNLDNDDGTTGQGHLSLDYVDIEWSGCAEEYPIVDALPYWDCTDDDSGGYGDGIGTATTTSLSAWIFQVDHSTFAYNTQDGADLLHLVGNGSTLIFDNSLAYGNMGQQIKVGSGSEASNNIVTTNCNALRYAITGTPPPLSSFTGTEGNYVAFTGTATSGSAVITGVSTTTGIQVGFRIYATAGNLPAGATVTAVDAGAGTITMSANATVTATESMNVGDTVLTGVTVTSGTITVGQFMSGTGIRPGTKVVSYDSGARTVTMSEGVGGSSGTAFTQAYDSALSDFCRAADTGIALRVSDATPTYFQFNTIYSASATSVEIDCNGTCTSATQLIYRNNIWLGFLNNAANGYPSGGTGDYSNPIYLSVAGLFSNAGSVFDHNLTYRWKSTWSCPMTAYGETNGLCVDPGLTNEAWPLYGYDNMAPASASSVVVGAGIAVSGITTDYNGNPRPIPPSMGALELADPIQMSTQGNITFSGSLQF